MIIGPSSASGVPTLSATATMLADPPIQLPASAAIPFQASGGSAGPNSTSTMGAPIMIPNDPASIITSAIGPNRITLRRSTVTIRRNSARVSMYCVIQSYAGDCGGISRTAVAMVGRKYASRTTGMTSNSRRRRAMPLTQNSAAMIAVSVPAMAVGSVIRAVGGGGIW